MTAKEFVPGVKFKHNKSTDELYEVSEMNYTTFKTLHLKCIDKFGFHATCGITKITKASFQLFEYNGAIGLQSKPVKFSDLTLVQS